MAEKGLVVVTGATGFVGKYVIADLLRAGYAVRGTVRNLSKAESVTAAISGILGSGVPLNLDFAEADLLDDYGWADAMAGATAVMHVAAAIRGDEPRDSSLVIKPALEGTARVMRFAHVGGIKRVIMTSSIATVGYGLGQTSGTRTYTEADFTDLDAMQFTWAYCIGKTKAERAAWDYANANGLDLTTIHPGAILGPASDPDTSISLGLVSGLLDGSTPAMPNVGFSIIDVRDVAALHIAAFEDDRSIGQRYLATSTYLRFSDVADILRKAYPDRAITQKLVPDWIMRILARFGGSVRQIINDIGNRKIFDGSKGEALLGRSYISGEQAVLSAAESVIALNLLKAPRSGRGH